MREEKAAFLISQAQVFLDNRDYMNSFINYIDARNVIGDDRYEYFYDDYCIEQAREDYEKGNYNLFARSLLKAVDEDKITAFLLELLSDSVADNGSYNKGLLSSIKYFDAEDDKEKKEKSKRIYGKAVELFSPTIYDIAVTKYNNGEFLQAKNMLSEIETFQDAKEYLDKIAYTTKLFGSWTKLNFLTYDAVSISSGSVIVYQYQNGTVNFHEEKIDSIKDGRILCNSGDVQYSFNSENGIDRFIKVNGAYQLASTYKRHSETPFSKPAEPYIGMSKLDAYFSIWGLRDKVNSTETSKTKREQWVYSGKKYLYFTDGVLDAIQK